MLPVTKYRSDVHSFVPVNTNCMLLWKCKSSDCMCRFSQTFCCCCLLQKTCYILIYNSHITICFTLTWTKVTYVSIFLNFICYGLFTCSNYRKHVIYNSHITISVFTLTWTKRTVKLSHVVTSIKQSPVLKCHFSCPIIENFI